MIAATTVAESFSFCCKLIEGDEFFSTGYLRVPQEWHTGNCFFSRTPQKEHSDIIALNTRLNVI